MGNCSFRLDGVGDFEGACNHLLTEHQLVCVHIVTIDDPWATTVAFFGK
jgi:hypothetical protein